MNHEFNPARLTLARMRRGLSMFALAKKLNLSTPQVYKYEHGEKIPDAETISNIGLALNFPSGFFFGETLDLPRIPGNKTDDEKRLLKIIDRDKVKK